MKKICLILMSILMFSSCSENISKNNNVNGSVDNVASVDKSDVDVVSEAILSDSLNADLYVQRARLNLANEKISNAIRDINSALSLDKKNIEALLVLADIYYALGDEDNILLTLNKASEYAPLDTRPIIKLSELSFLQGNFRMAEAYVDKALEMDRYNPKAYYMRGMIAMSANDTVEAMKNFMTSRMQQSDFVDPLIQIAHIYMAKNDTLAKSFFKEAMLVAPNNYYLVYDYAMYLQENGFPEEALSYYDSLLKIMPNNTDFNFNKGYVYLVYLGENEKALECFDKVLQIDPNSVNALFNKGRTYEQMGDYINAKSIYLQILRNNPDYQLAIDAVNRISE
ncbi:MAG: tetratricopeptide repeat protein, partial [Clostridia bacterium]|nr:tetratricopeptide repeat protein [Clostridia bacterium]